MKLTQFWFSLIPMLSLAQNLVDRGCRITYVTAASTADEMLKLWPIKRTDPDAVTKAGRLRLVGIGKAASHGNRTATEFIWRNIVTLVQFPRTAAANDADAWSSQSQHFEPTLKDLLREVPMMV